MLSDNNCNDLVAFDVILSMGRADSKAELFTMLQAVLLLTSLGVVRGDVITQVADLRHRLYQETKLAPACVRLLNATSMVGCGTGGLATAPLLHMQDAVRDDVTEPSVVLLVAEEQLSSLIWRGYNSRDLQKRTTGILVIPATSHALPSPAATFPLAEHAPYKDRGYAWNTHGSDISRLYIGKPIFLLDEATAAAALGHAAANAEKGFRPPVFMAELDDRMYAAGNASACIAAGTCMPLGGHSVWAALPPVPAAGDAKPITLVLAGVDSTAFFHDRAKGAEAPLSGLIAMLAAAEALGSSGHAAQYRRRLVFAALSGEPWGLMGSKRLLWELAAGGNATSGLDLARIDQVVELGQLGLAEDGLGSSSFYLHAQRGKAFGDASALAEAFKAAGDAQAKVQSASSANPGIPPSSLMAFLRARPSIAGVIMADFDAHFRTPFFQSRLDANISVEAVTSAALVAARALHALAWGTSHGLPPLPVARDGVRETVAALVGCLLHGDPGFSCPLVQGLMNPVSAGEPAHYMSTLPLLGQDAQDPSPFLKKDVERFLWNFLAAKTASGTAAVGGRGNGRECDFGSRRCREGDACIGFRADGPGGAAGGRCMRATARYVPSHSTHFGCKEGSCREDSWAFQWGMSNASAEWEAALGWPPDPEWTESNWPPAGVPQYRLYQREAEGTEGRILLAGLLVAAASVAATQGAKLLYERRARKGP